MSSYKSQSVLFPALLLVALSLLASGLAAQSPKKDSSKDAKKNHAQKDDSQACDSDNSNFCGLAAHYDYPSRLGLDFTEFNVEKRDKALLIDL